MNQNEPKQVKILKPLFIPLKRKYFEQFAMGRKTAEFRPFGPRWNHDTCFVGREVILSLGYGRQKRLSGVILDAYQDHSIAFNYSWQEVYGDRKVIPFAIFIGDIKEIL